MDTLWIQINLRSFINQMDASSWFMTPFWFKCRFFAMSLDCDGGTNILWIYQEHLQLFFFLEFFLLVLSISCFFSIFVVIYHKNRVLKVPKGKSFKIKKCDILLYDTTCVNCDFWVKPVWGLGCLLSFYHVQLGWSSNMAESV